MIGQKASNADSAGADNPKWKRLSHSLAFKLAILAVVPFLALSTFLLLGVVYQFERLSERTIGSQEMQFTMPVVDEIDEALRSAHEVLIRHAKRIANLRSLDDSRLQELFEREYQILPMFSEGLQVTDADNRVITSVGPVRTKRLEQADYSFPKPGPDSLTSLPFEALSTRGHPAVAQTVPIVIEGQTRFFLSAASDLLGPRYLGPYRNPRFGQFGFYSLTAPNRIIILHPDPERVLSFAGAKGSSTELDRGLDGFQGWLTTKVSSGAPMITAVRRIPSTGWVLTVSYPKQAAQYPFLSARRDLMFALAAAGLALLAIILFLSGRMLRPLSMMTRRVEALACGNNSVQPVSFTSNDEIGVLSRAFNRLVSERLEAEIELRASEERFRLAFRTSPEPIAMTRLHDNVLVAVNEAFEQLFRVSEEDALGCTIEDLGITIDSPVRMLASRDLNGPVISRDSVLRVATASERRIDLSVSQSIVNIRGVPHVLTMSRDVTALRAAEAERERLTLELKRSEERHRRVVRNVPVVQWALDSDGTFTLAEGLGLLALGFRSEEMVGSKLFKLYGDNARLLEYFGRAREGQVLSGVFEQGDAAFDSHWGPLRDESGRIVGVTAIALDVTERRRAEQAQRETESRMGLLERLAATGRLAAGVAHEINNPLTYVISNLEEIKVKLSSQNESESLQCATEALDGAGRVASIVRNLSVFSGRSEQGQPSCNPEKVARSAAALVRNQIRHRATLELDCHDTPPARIDDGRLAQVLVNLLMNACQAIPEGNFEGNFIRLRVRFIEPCVVVEVTDTGRGIAPEIVPHLFEPFFTTRAIGEGSGLGLSVSYAIVTQQGGSIDVQTCPGHGTTFRVKLPVATEAAAEVPPPEERPVRSGSPTAKGLRLLIIDDEPLVGRAVARHLREHKVTVELQAQTAFERLRGGEEFDVILCDMMMPEMSGTQLYEKLRTEVPACATRVIFMSGGAFSPEAQAFLACSKVAVYEKPLDLGLLSKHLRTLAEDSTQQSRA